MYNTGIPEILEHRYEETEHVTGQVINLYRVRLCRAKLSTNWIGSIDVYCTTLDIVRPMCFHHSSVGAAMTTSKRDC